MFKLVCASITHRSLSGILLPTISGLSFDAYPIPARHMCTVDAIVIRAYSLGCDYGWSWCIKSSKCWAIIAYEMLCPTKLCPSEYKTCSRGREHGFAVTVNACTETQPRTNFWRRQAGSVTSCGSWQTFTWGECTQPLVFLSLIIALETGTRTWFSYCVAASPA